LRGDVVPRAVLSLFLLALFFSGNSIIQSKDIEAYKYKLKAYVAGDLA
jgi:hypothetical protein